MYAIVTRRQMNRARMQETGELARSEFLPKIQQAPGFVSFSLIQGEDGINTAVVFFQSKEHAEGFRGEAEAWTSKLDAFGHQFEGQSVGEVVEHLSTGAQAVS
jgi:hypothetical protein